MMSIVWGISFLPNTVYTKQKGAAVEGPPAMGPSLQLSTC